MNGLSISSRLQGSANLALLADRVHVYTAASGSVRGYHFKNFFGSEKMFLWGIFTWPTRIKLNKLLRYWSGKWLLKFLLRVVFYIFVFYILNIFQHLNGPCTGQDVGKLWLRSVVRSSPYHWSWLCGRRSDIRRNFASRWDCDILGTRPRSRRWVTFWNTAWFVSWLRTINRSHSTTRTSLEHDELAESGWRCQQLYKKTRTRVFGALLLPALLYSCETWTLTIELKRSVNFFVDTMSLRRVLRYRWHDYLSSYLCWERLGCDKSPPYFRSTNYASIGMWRDSLRRP